MLDLCTTELPAGIELFLGLVRTFCCVNSSKPEICTFLQRDERSLFVL